MTGTAVLLLARPIVRHRDRFAQGDERGDGWSADEGHLVRAREHRGSNAGFLLGHHLGSGRPRQSDGSVAAVMMMWPVTSLLAHLWHPKRANERHLPTNTVGRRARFDNGSGAFLPVAVACSGRPVRVAPDGSQGGDRTERFDPQQAFRIMGRTESLHAEIGAPHPIVS